MIVFRVKQLPTIGDYFTYQGDKYQLIQNPEKTTQYLWASQARYVWDGGYRDKAFYFELI